MAPVIRIDEEVWKQLQERASPLVDTPNSVLRRILKLEEEGENAMRVGNESEFNQQAENKKDSIFIIINAAGKIANKENALLCESLIDQRVNTGIDILGPKRFINARKLKHGARILMHQGGAKSFRGKYPRAGCLVAAGKVKEIAREINEIDKQKHSKDYKLRKEVFKDTPIAGIIFYDFPKGMAKQPLPREYVPYRPMPGDNFIEIKPNDCRYPKLDEWWNVNFN